jgi:hypothetical protein
MKNAPSVRLCLCAAPTSDLQSGCEVIVFCGSPVLCWPWLAGQRAQASGKSSWGKRWLPNYVWINQVYAFSHAIAPTTMQDTLKTKEKCVKACREALSAGKSCIIDNTNPEPATRKCAAAPHYLSH